jgi:hypothetical protein
MMKRLIVLMAILAVMLVAAVPAMAQDSSGGDEISVTGMLREGLPADVVGDGTHAIVDEATGTLYALRSAGADLDAYAGQSVTVYGTLTPGEDFPGNGGIASGTLPSIDVSRIESSDQPSITTPATYTVTFELAVEGQPPAGTTFFAQGPVDPRLADGGGIYQLTDPDGDGIYTASTVVPPGDYPVSFVQGVSTVLCDPTFGGTCPGEPVSVIEDLGTVSVGQDTAYSASVSFDGQVAPTPGGPSTGEGAGTTASDQYTEGAATGGTMGPSENNGILATILPDTGGISLGVLGAGVLLLGAGILTTRRFLP